MNRWLIVRTTVATPARKKNQSAILKGETIGWCFVQDGLNMKRFDTGKIDPMKPLPETITFELEVRADRPPPKE